ncbi:SsrA-binding protein [Alkalispirochaeta americana]|uniref:SsrA-binding protein n=1 Tax=Alkalispirochaeta americana TaxID=159291 RepID=A0A1N6P9V4_9SPIO|nr:SsrA-binding protein SmpB [Alkalispirochaeta americana]SIQ01151.1 SsrA-binding protein [Alkalispirochaeta americana]
MAERKTLARNRRAFYEYQVEDTLEVGIILQGTEVKSMRRGKFSFADAYARIIQNELWLVGLHITEYTHGNLFNHDPTRRRKLLCHADELDRLRRRVDEKGFTLVPLEFYLKQGLIKMALGVCKGKKLYDKRESLKAKDQKREMDRELRKGL